MVHPAWVYKVVLWNRKIHKERQIVQTNVVSQTQGHFADFAIAVEGQEEGIPCSPEPSWSETIVASRAEVKQFALASNAIVLLPALRLLGAQPPIPRNAEQALRL